MSKFDYIATVFMVGAFAHAAHAQQDNAALDNENTPGQENCVVERVQLPDGRYSEVGRCVNGDEEGSEDIYDRVTGSLEGAIAKSEQIRHEAMVKSGDYEEAKAAILAEAKKLAQMPEGAARDAKEQRLKSLAKEFQSRFGNKGRVKAKVKNVVRNSRNGAVSNRRGYVDASGRITPAGSGGGAIGGVQPTPAGTPGRNPAGTPGRNGGDDLARPQICPPICGDDDLAKPQPHREADAKDGRRAKNRNGARRSSIGTRSPNPAGTPNPGNLGGGRYKPIGKPNCKALGAPCTDDRPTPLPKPVPNPGDLACPAVVPECGSGERLKKTGTDAAGCTQYRCVAKKKRNITPLPKPVPNRGDLACPAVVNKPSCGPREWLKRGTNAAGCPVYQCVSMKRNRGSFGALEPNPAGTRNPTPKGDAKAKKGRGGAVEDGRRATLREKRAQIREKRMERRKKRMERREKRKEMRKTRMERREKRERRQAQRQKQRQAKSRGGATVNDLINGPDGFRGARDLGGLIRGDGSPFRPDGARGFRGGSFVAGGGGRDGGGFGGPGAGSRGAGDATGAGSRGSADASGTGSRGGGASSSAGPTGGESGLGGARGGAMGDGSRGSSSAGPTGGESGLGGARGGALGDGSRGSSSAGPAGGDSGLGGARGGAMGDGSRGGGSDGGGSDGGGSDGGGSGGSGGAGGAGDR